MTAAEAALQARPRPSLTEGPIAPMLLKLAAPGILAMFVQAAMNVTDAYFLGRLGGASLAGAALVFPMLMLMTMLSAGAIGGGVAGATARALGAGDIRLAEDIMRHALVVALGAAALFGLLFHLFGRSIYGALGGSGSALDLALAYSDWLFAGIAGMWVFNMLGSVVRGSGRMVFSALSIALVTAVQIPLAGVLVLGAGPVPALGIAGAAIATTAAYAIGAAMLLVHFLAGRGRLRLRRTGRLRASLFAETLRTGAFGAVNPFLTVAVILTVNAFVGRMGQSALAGYGIGARLEFLMVPVIFGIGAALIAMVGANVGAGQHARAVRVAWTGAFAAAAVTGTIGLAAALFPAWWADAFTAEPAIAAACRAYLRTVGPCYAVFGLGLALYFASHALRSIAWPVMGGIARLIVIGGGCAWLALTDRISLDGLFAVIAAGMLCYGAFNALTLHFLAWRRGP